MVETIFIDIMRYKSTTYNYNITNYTTYLSLGDPQKSADDRHTTFLIGNYTRSKQLQGSHSINMVLKDKCQYQVILINLFSNV